MRIIISLSFIIDKCIGAIYISTEAAFPVKRLNELIQNLDVIQDYDNINGDIIFVEHIATIVIKYYLVLNIRI